MHGPAVFWHLNKDYSELSQPNNSKTKVLSTVTSGLYFGKGRKARLDFINYIQDKVNIDLYGREFNRNIPNKPRLKDFKAYMGPLGSLEKSLGFSSYKYTVAVENCSEKKYFTEKLVDGILSECLCFYWECPNIQDFFDPMAFVLIDPFKQESSLETIQKCIEKNEWEKRIKYIRQEKLKILNELQLMPKIQSIIT